MTGTFQKRYLCLQLATVHAHISRPGPLVPCENSDCKLMAFFGVCDETYKGHGHVLVEERLGIIVIGQEQDAASKKEGGGEVMAARGGRGRRGEAAEEQGRVWAGESGPERGEGKRAGHGCDFEEMSQERCSSSTSSSGGGGRVGPQIPRHALILLIYLLLPPPSTTILVYEYK